MYWSFWLGGLALASVALLHFLWVRRLMSVSSRVTSLVERARGEGTSSGDSAGAHLVFFLGLALGGLAASLTGGRFAITGLDVGARFSELFGTSPAVTAVVVTLGGVLVGVGTRMAKGCTSGHGLCGVARFERGSLLATCAFFGTGVVVSLLLSLVLGAGGVS